MSRFTSSLVIVILTIAGCSLAYVQKAYLSHREETHSPTAKMISRLDKITSTLKALDDEVVASVYKAFSEVVDEENSRTSLLQQRASSLLSAAALVVSIIVTSIGLMFKDGRKYLRENDLRILSGIVYSILFLFAISLYWTWEAFSTRPYMSFNVDSLVNNLDDKNADLHMSQVAAIRQEYQITENNRSLNTEKAAALQYAAIDLFLGLLMFLAFCLFFLAQTSRSVLDKGARLKQKKSDACTGSP